MPTNTSMRLCQTSSQLLVRRMRARLHGSPTIRVRAAVVAPSTQRRSLADSAAATKVESSKTPNLLVKAGIPFVLFSVLASWVVSNALDGKLREQEVSQGKTSVSLRQAKLKEEHDEMMERLNKIVQADFDNTKRIKRPHEILEERRLERERRNKWYRRWWRAITERSQS